MDYIIQKIIYDAPAVLIALSLHEFAHGWASYMLGDPTPKAQGRISLNPLHHLDLVGTLLLFFVGFGWAKPVQVDSRYYENPKSDMVKVALAGPIMNFIVAFIAIFIVEILYKLDIGINLLTGYILLLLQYIAIINIGLGIFNLIPIPPLDGSKVLMAVLPPQSYFSYMKYEQFGMIILIMFIYLGAFDGFLTIARNATMAGMDNIAMKILGLF
jgi:Zn-dependent protease